MYPAHRLFFASSAPVVSAALPTACKGASPKRQGAASRIGRGPVCTWTPTIENIAASQPAGSGVLKCTQPDIVPFAGGNGRLRGANSTLSICPCAERFTHWPMCT